MPLPSPVGKVAFAKQMTKEENRAAKGIGEQDVGRHEVTPTYVPITASRCGVVSPSVTFADSSLTEGAKS